MPIIKSAKKRVKVAQRATAQNLRTKRTLRKAVKAFTTSKTSKDFKQAQSAIDTAVKKGVIHKNKAARQKKQLVSQLKAQPKKAASTPKKKPAVKKK